MASPRDEYETKDLIWRLRQVEVEDESLRLRLEIQTLDLQHSRRLILQSFSEDSMQTLVYNKAHIWKIECKNMKWTFRLLNIVGG